MNAFHEDMKQNPTVSVIIATYNRAALLCKAIESVLTQTYTQLELIVIDDRSTDGTQLAVSNFIDPRIKYLFQTNKGRSNARNLGLSMAKGRYIAFLDSDDIYLPDKLAIQVSYMERNPRIGMIYTSAYCIDEFDKLLSHEYHANISGSLYEQIAFFVPVTITLPTVMVRRDIFSRTGGFDEKMHRFEDTDMWRRISKITHIDAMKDFTCKLRTHSDNHLRAQNPEQLIDAVHYYAKKILRDDTDKSLLIRHRGLGGLYHYYASALISVPEWQEYGQQLLQVAHHYWPLYTVPGIRHKLFKHVMNILRNSRGIIRRISLIGKVVFSLSLLKMRNLK